MPEDSVGTPPHLAVVTGDVTVDWNLARTRELGSDGSVWSAGDSTRAYRQRGGAALLADLTAAVAEQLREEESANFEVRAPRFADGEILPEDPRLNHSYSIWSLFPSGRSAKLRNKPRVWRVEEFLGLDPGSHEPDSESGAIGGDSGTADLVVLDDAGLGFRDREDLWPATLRGTDAPSWVVLKMASPVARGPLWKHLHHRFAERLIVVATVDDLRRSEIKVSRELSWERTAQDLAWELTKNPQVNALSQCAHVVVSFGTAGVFLMSREEDEPRCRLFFDPEVIEGMWTQDYPGGMIGYTGCLTTAIVRELMLAPSAADVHRGINAGIAAARSLHIQGYGEAGSPAESAGLVFPTQRVVQELAVEPEAFAMVDVEDPMRHLAATSEGTRSAPRVWSILKDKYRDGLELVAQQTALDGLEGALEGVPVGRFGHLVTVDRREIEAFRSVRSLIIEYKRQRSTTNPLSIAVFGAPGSGKSFGIVQVVKTVLPGEIEKLTFNLSQFNDPEELTGAFHQIRDVALSGLIPLVFWDEFDTALGGQPLGWLRYFLSPMQDGSFQQGQITHPIGRSLFVFAGGTADKLENFGNNLEPEELKKLKVPDFVSRLKGYANILGPNPVAGAGDAEGSKDAHFLERRALLLRALLGKHRPELFQDVGGRKRLNIDPGVLRAFLETREFLHGARSMESIITMSALAGKRVYERSSLPPEAQLDLHVDSRDFLSLVRKVELTGDVLEQMASAAHSVYREGLAARDATTDLAELSYDKLPKSQKEQNRLLVRDIADKLNRIGYVMLPARGEELPFNFPDADLDDLSEQEHDRWMKAKIAEGYRYGSERADTGPVKLHPSLVLWKPLSEEELAVRFTEEERAALGPGELDEKEKEKDRDLVRGVPRIVAEAGYAVVKTQTGS